MLKKHLPLAGMLYVQVSNAAMFLITRVALTQGLSHYLYVLYRQAIATLALVPLAFFLERGQRSKLTWRNVGKLSVLGFLRITMNQNLYYAGLSLTSSTLSTTMNNLVPALTFAMAVALRLEKVDVWSGRGQAKVWGTLLGVGGATVMTLFEGPAIVLLNDNNSSTALLPTPSLSVTSQSPTISSWILGALLLAGAVWALSTCIVYQALIAQDCPPQLTSTAVMCSSGTIQTALVALLLEKPSAWRLNWDLQLLAISYSAIFCSAIGLFVQMWCIKVKGPVFSSIFSPLSTVLVAILEPLLLHVPLHWGSLTGMVMVIGGLYCVLWAKAKEEEEEPTRKVESILRQEPVGSIREPLLTQSREETR